MRQIVPRAAGWCESGHMRIRLSLLVTAALVAVACTSQATDGDAAVRVADVQPAAPVVAETGAVSDSAEPAADAAVSYAGTVAAPEFPDDLDWLNTDRPLAISQLRGKVVALDFWTYGCINCIHVIPDIERLEKKYADELVVIGVHSAKFDNERTTENIRQVVIRYGLEHAVVNDGDFEVWEAYGASAWPTMFVVDPAGKISGFHAGEGVFEVLDPVIASLVAEFDEKGSLDRTPIELRLERETVPQTVLSFPGKVTVGQDRMFIADTNHHRIVAAKLDGEVLAVYGSGLEGFTDGVATGAAFDEPQGMALGPDGRVLYVADTGNHTIRAIDLESGMVSTAAGTGVQGAWPPTGGAASVTPLHSPWDLELAGDVLFVAMAGTHQIWEYDLTSDDLAPYAGSGAEGTDNSSLASSSLAQPSGLSLAADGRLYFADSESSSIRWADTTGTTGVHTLAGSDRGLFDFGDADGVGTAALLQHPLGVVADGSDVWIVDTYNSKIKHIDSASGEVTTIAGRGAGWGDGADPLFYEPGGLDLAEGVLYVADTNNHAIRRVDTVTGAAGTVVLRGIEEFLPAPGDEGYAGTIVQHDPITVGTGTGSIVLDVVIPDGYKVNPEAPSRFEWSADAGVINLAPDSNGVQINPSFPLEFGSDFGAGSTALVGDLSIVYCDAETEAICLFEQVRVNVPVTVIADAAASEVTIHHEIILPEL